MRAVRGIVHPRAAAERRRRHALRTVAIGKR
jgi:hypothetical protein